MRKTLTLMLMVAALSFAGCKKKTTEDTGTTTGSSDTAGSSMAGSSMAGSDMAGSGSAMAGSSMAGSGTAMAGSGSAMAAGSGLDPSCEAYAARFAKCDKLDPKLKESMPKIFEALKAQGQANSKETCGKAAKGWDATLQKAGC